GALEPLWADIEGDHPGAHRLGILRGGEPDRALTENRDGVVARKVHPAQRTIGGARTARDRCTRRERQLVRQGYQGVGRHFQVVRMAAMGVIAVHLDRDLLAELLPAGAAMVALRAALIVMHHHALADPRLL